MKILLTGIAGFLGGPLARRLSTLGYDIVGAGRRPSAFAPEIRHAPLDVRDPSAVDSLIARERPAAIFHLAAIAVLDAASGDGGAASMLATNVAGTWNVLEASRRHGVGAVVMASSDKQYGALAATPYDDSDSTAFQNGGVYELSKAQSDQVARLFAGLYDTPAVRVARYANMYGPGDESWSRIVPGTIRRALEGVAPRVTAGPAGAALREYVFVDDAIDASIALLNDAYVRGNAPLRRVDGKLARVAFNLGSENRHPAGEVVAIVQKTLADEFGVAGLPPEILPGTPGVFEPGSQCSRLARIRELLPEYNPRPLADGLRETIPWYLDRLRSQ